MSTKKAQKVAQKLQQSVDRSTRLQQPQHTRTEGLIYVGHLPYGFVEEGLKDYFTQFGDVLGVKLFRSKHSNRVQGYGFVKFTDKEVAEIAAEAMNGYLMNGKKLTVNVLSDEHPDPFKYKHGSSKLFFINWAERFVQEQQEEKTNEQIVGEIEKLLANEETKKQKLKELGIKYTYPGFVGVLQQ